MTGAALAADPRVVELGEIVARLTSASGISGEAAAEEGDDLGRALAGLKRIEARVDENLAAAAELGRRLADVEEVLLSFVSFDFSRRARVAGEDDTLDGIAAGVNCLGEEFSARAVSKAFVDNIIASMRDALLVVGASDKISMVNESALALLGYRGDELSGRSFSDVLPDVSAGEIIQAGGIADLECACRTSGGASVPVILTASVLRDADDNPSGLVLVARDLSEAKRLEEERWKLREAMQRQSIMVEELSTPLIPISKEIVVMPLIGTVDTQRGNRIMETLLTGIVGRQASVAILDITGVRTMDTSALHGLMRAIQGVRLIGAQPVVTGVRPDVARTVVDLGVELDRIVTFGTLQDGIAFAMKVVSDSRRGRSRVSSSGRF